MAEDHLADNLNGNTGAGSIGGGISSQIVRPERNADHFSGFSHHHPGSLIGDWKYPVLAALAAFGGVFPQPFGNLLGDEDDLSFSAALGFP